MKKLILIALSVLTVTGLYFVANKTEAQVDDTKYQITVTGGGIEFNVFSGELDLGSIVVSNATGHQDELSGTYTANTFVLEDLDALDGSWQVTAETTNLTGTTAGNLISNDQIYIEGHDMNVAVGAGLASCETDITGVPTGWAQFNSTQTLFTRPTLTNNATCRVGTTLTLGVAVPAYQAVDVYDATIVVTSISNAAGVNPTYNSSLVW